MRFFILLVLAWKSLWNRRLSSSLAMASVGLSVLLVLGVYKVKESVENSFNNTISQTDLVVGARGGSLQLLLYSVFHMGQAMNNIRWSSYEAFSQHRAVAWSVPISLGDNFRGHRVVATSADFFRHYKFFGDQKPEFATGRSFEGHLEVVLGSEVAKIHGLKLNSEIILSHGLSKEALSVEDHSDNPFIVSGILRATGTPLDRALFISLEGMDLIHGVDVQAAGYKPEQITSFLLGMKSRVAVLHLQREIALYEPEPLMAIVPGMILSELWNNLSVIESALSVIGIFVVLLSFVGLLVNLYASLESRQRELALLRISGARPWQIVALLCLESFWMTFCGAFLALICIWGFGSWGAQWIASAWGLSIVWNSFSSFEVLYLASLCLASLLLALLPAWKAYRNSLSDSLHPQ